MLSTEATTARDVAITSYDGLRLHARCWNVPSPRGVVVLAHGFGEHGACYENVALAVCPAAGVDLVAADLRGHGRSPGRRGVVGHYDELTSDLIAAFDWAGRERPGLPRFLLGHSNGGQVVLRAALDPEAGPKVDGLILSNPSLHLAVRVPGYKLRLGRFLHKHAPWVTLPSGLRTELLTRDPEMRRERDADRLSHGRISAPLFFGMVDGGRRVIERAGEITHPVLLILGGSDRIVDPAASREAFDRMGSSDKTLLDFPEMLHEPFNEIGREEVFASLVGWLDRRLPGVTGG